jgi:flagellar basal-body rod protein FlgB
MDKTVVESKLIASNVANVDTPGYKAKELKFDDMLKNQMGSLQLKMTHPKHMTDAPSVVPNGEIVENPNPGRPDGNNVNIDEEMLKLTKNNIQYNVAVQLLSKRTRYIKDALQAASK